MFFDLLKLYISIFFVLLLPGYFLYALILNKKPSFNIKSLLFSFVLSIFSVDFLIILINKFSIVINFLNIIISISTLLLILWFFVHKKVKPLSLFKKIKFKIKLSKKNILFFLILLFAVVLRLVFLSDRITPSSTDLGHHMYWSNYIVEFHQLPQYNMPDFIIGEHIIFGVISILSGISVISSMPVAIIFLINIFSLLAIYLLAKEISLKAFNIKNDFIPLLAFLAIGVFYSSSSPQSNYVSGGVIGNIIGNLLIPTALITLTKAIFDKDKKFASLFFIIIACLGFTHHLSSFIFIYSFLGYLIILILILFFKFIQNKISFDQIKKFILSRLKIFFCWKNILIISLIMIWIIFIHIPSYLNPSAIDVAMGEPSKETRTGLGLNEIISTAGAWRLFYGLIGLFGLLFLIFKQKKSQIIATFLIPMAWFLMIFMMSYKPELLKVDIPSNRIGNYIVYPTALLSAFGIYFLLKLNKNNQYLLKLLFLVIFASGFISGLSEFSLNKQTDSDTHEIYQTYIATQYLKNEIPDKNQKVLKDHNFLQGDTWMKLFFMQGYKYPLSRSYLRRYNDPIKPRETCTRDMISIPDSEVGEKCFEEYKVKYIVLKKNRDDSALLKSDNFSVIYINNDVLIFQKN